MNSQFNDMVSDPVGLQTIAGRFREEVPEICFALLFGSTARGEAGNDSDTDIGLYITTGRKPVDLIPMVTGIIESVIPDRPSDISFLNEADPILAMEALKGKLFYIREDAWDLYAGFYSLTSRMYEDETAWIQKQLQYRGYEVQWSH